MTAMKALIACSSSTKFFNNSALLSLQCGAPSSEQQERCGLRVQCKSYVCRATAVRQAEERRSHCWCDWLKERFWRGHPCSLYSKLDFCKFSDTISFRDVNDSLSYVMLGFR
jgi:hypothetical protein